MCQMAPKARKSAMGDSDLEDANVDPADAAVALDLLLTDAALGMAYQFRHRSASVRMAGKLATKPKAVAKRSSELVAELTRIATGSSELAPSAVTLALCPNHG